MARTLNHAWIAAGGLLASAWASAALAAPDPDAQPASIVDLARSLGISQDQTRPANPLTVNVFGKPMIIGGELSAPAQWRSNYAFTDGGGDDQIKTSPSLEVDDIWALSDTLATFVSLTPQFDSTVYREGGGASTTGGIELSQAWLIKTRLFGTPFALQVGRQFYQDEREWWWNQNLDSVRLHYFGRNLTAFIGVGRELGHKSTLAPTPLGDPGVVRVLGNVQWSWAPRQTLEAYFLDQNDRSHEMVENRVVAHDVNDQGESNLTWFGLRARGRFKGGFPLKVYYSGDVAGVTGTQTTGTFTPVSATQDMVTQVASQKVRGWAYDASVTLESPFRPTFYLTLGYADGSGHRAADGALAYAFRQSGLDANAGKFRGLGRFHYYGEVLRPELSNLAISTVSLGAPVTVRDSIETVWHHYRQPVADTRIAGAYLGIDPNGVAHDIGDEVDLVVSHRPNDAVDLEFVAGGFRAGPAFDSRQGAWASLVKIKLNLSF